MPAKHIARAFRNAMPTREGLATNRFVKPVAHRVLAPELWRFTRRSVPRGVALGLVIIAVAVAELGNIAVDQPDFLIFHLGIALRDSALTESQRFHLGSAQRDPGFIYVLDRIFEPRTAVLSDDLDLVELFRTRASHKILSGKL